MLEFILSFLAAGRVFFRYRSDIALEGLALRLCVVKTKSKPKKVGRRGEL